MRKLGMITLVVVVVGVLSVGAFAHYQGKSGQWQRPGQTMTPQGSMYGPRGGMMPQRGMGRQGMMTPNTTPMNPGSRGWWKGETPTATEVMTEEKAKTVAEEYIAKYLTGYTIEKIEKDQWRPMYFVTITGANDVKQMMAIHGYSGQVVHVFPVPVATETETK